MLLFSILAIVTGCHSSRGIATFIDVHRRRLNEAFGLAWRRAPAHSAIRYILQRLDAAAVEAPHCFRWRGTSGQGGIALDGKTLRGSFELAHIDIAEKSNEIPAAQKMLTEFGLADGAVITIQGQCLPWPVEAIAASLSRRRHQEPVELFGLATGIGGVGP